MTHRSLSHIVLALLALATGLAAAARDKQPAIAPSYAWTVSDPLGVRFPSTIDTLFENYHTQFIPSLRSKAWATTGNYGAEGQNQIFMERPQQSDFFFEDALHTWLPTLDKLRFYNTRIPMTLLSHATGGDKYSNQDRTTAIFSGNVNRQIQVGTHMDYIYSKGSYDYQADKDFSWGAFGSYLGDRYELQASFSNYNFLNKESGGITNDLYITDPAQVQGGESSVDPKDIPTRLTAAHSRVVGQRLWVNNRYKLGFYRYQRDSVKTDSIISKTYVPVTSFIWTLDYRHSNHKFINQQASQDTAFFQHTYLGLDGTNEVTRFMQLRNTVGVSLLEGFNRWAKFGFALYASHAMRRYTQVADTITGRYSPSALGLDSIPVTVDHKHTSQLFWVGGQLTKQRGSLLTYNAQAELGVAGDVSGDIDISGDVATRFFLWRDTVALRAYGYFKNLEAPYLMQNYVSNHFAWHNNFSKTRRLRLGGQLTVPFTGSVVNVAYETLKNHVFFAPDGTPAQAGSPIHVFSASLNQRLAWRALHLDNDLTYQATSNDQVLPLPKFAIYSNLYLKFTVARVLHCQIGVDANYYTRYYAPAYAPATMSFINQRDTKCGDFAFMNLYANFKMKQARFFIQYSHFNKGLLGGDRYFSVPHYPLNPARFQLGVSVNFLN